MPFPIAVEGSFTNNSPPAPGPGIIEIGALSVFATGLPVATVGDPLTPHQYTKFNPQCKLAFVATGNPTVLVEGRPVAFLGSKCTCGHIVTVLCVPNVMVGP
jgi:uncharacterized Zn-binding protein involved in type VI secretion